MATSWTIDKIESGVHRVTFGGANYPDLWTFLSSDWHWDNPKARLDLIERDLRQAKAVGGMVICSTKSGMPNGSLTATSKLA